MVQFNVLTRIIFSVPFDCRAKTHIQAGSRHHSKETRRSIFRLLIKIMKEEGVSGFYKGFAMNMVSVFTQRMISF